MTSLDTLKQSLGTCQNNSKMWLNADLGTQKKWGKFRRFWYCLTGRLPGVKDRFAEVRFAAVAKEIDRVFAENKTELANNEQLRNALQKALEDFGKRFTKRPKNRSILERSIQELSSCTNETGEQTETRPSSSTNETGEQTETRPEEGTDKPAESELIVSEKDEESKPECLLEIPVAIKYADRLPLEMKKARNDIWEKINAKASEILLTEQKSKYNRVQFNVQELVPRTGKFFNEKKKTAIAILCEPKTERMDFSTEIDTLKKKIGIDGENRMFQWVLLGKNDILPPFPYNYPATVLQWPTEYMKDPNQDQEGQQEFEESITKFVKVVFSRKEIYE